MAARSKKKVAGYLDKVKKASSVKSKVEILGDHFLGKCFPKTKFHHLPDGFQLKADGGVVWVPMMIPKSQYFWFMRKYPDDAMDKRTVRLQTTIKSLRDDLDHVKTKKGMDTLIHKSLPELKKEFKVHLQPRPEKLEALVCSILTIPSSPVKMFKVLADFDQAITDNMPMVACYFDLYNDVEREVERFILHLKGVVSPIDKPENALGIVPRFNARVEGSSMIFWAQSSGDLKEDIIKILVNNGWKNTYFTEDYVKFL